MSLCLNYITVNSISIAKWKHLLLKKQQNSSRLFGSFESYDVVHWTFTHIQKSCQNQMDEMMIDEIQREEECKHEKSYTEWQHMHTYPIVSEFTMKFKSMRKTIICKLYEFFIRSKGSMVTFCTNDSSRCWWRFFFCSSFKIYLRQLKSGWRKFVWWTKNEYKWPLFIGSMQIKRHHNFFFHWLIKALKA